MQMVNYEARGIPFGRAAEVNLRNNHAQYIFTWCVVSSPPSTYPNGRARTLADTSSRYGLAVATSIMLWMVIKRPSSEITRRVRRSKTL